MKSQELASTFRSELADMAQPPLWTDDDIARYMDDAQKMFCRLTEGIEDSRTIPLSRVYVTPNAEWYDLSPLVLKVRYATRTDTGADVPIHNPETARDNGIRFSGRSGPLCALVQGMTKGALRAYPVPAETVEVELGVFRLPLKKLDFRDNDECLEIDEQHHTHLMLWMKHLAYDKQDADTIDRRKAVEYEDRFLKYCEKARQEQERARRKVGSVVYGGIPMGPAGRGVSDGYGRSAY